MSIPSELLNRLHTTLLRCEAFGSNEALEAVFVDERIGQWAADLPEATSDDKRIRATIKYLLGKRDANGEHALVLLLRVLCEQMPPGDARHQELADLAAGLEREFKLHPPHPEAPESSAQKFRHFLFGDTEAQRAYCNRQAMLKLVHNTWIKGVLEQSLHGAALIELGMEYDPAAVDHPWDMVVQMPERPDTQIPPGTRIVDVFDDVGGSLLILGEPGSGKTTMLLELARDLIARAEGDPLQSIPVVFNLSSWAVKQQPLADWLVEELRNKYYVPKKTAQVWIEDDTLALLLDGLDEVKTDARDKCVTAINAFREEHIVPLAVCCRITDYETMTIKLHFHGAICLRSLTPAQIDAYLLGAGVELQAVRATLRHDPVLQEMAESPLFISIMTLAYHDKTIVDLQSLTTPEARRQHFFDTYIERMFQRRAKAGTYTLEQTRHWLVWLAGQLNDHNQTLFYIENLQPTWLPAPEAKRTRRLAPLVSGLLSSLVVGLVLGLTIGLFFGLADGLFAALVFGMVGGLAGGLLVETDTVKLVEALIWSWQKTCIGLVGGLVFGLGVGLLDELFGGPLDELVSKLLGEMFVGLFGLFFGMLHGLVGGLASGLAGGLVGGLVFGLGVGEIESKTTPTQGIRQSVRNALVVGLSVGLVGGLSVGLIGRLVAGPVDGLLGGLFVGLVSGLVAGLSEKGGGGAVILHYTLRAVLARTDRAPWNYARFLDYCVDRIFLRRVGGGYIFVHRLLQEHFTSLTPEDIERIAGGSRATA